MEDSHDVLDPIGKALLESIVRGANGELLGVIFFGSRRSGVVTTSASAYDFLAVGKETLRALYESWRSAGLLRRSPALLSFVSSILPPTQVRLCSDGDGGPVAKVAVLSARALQAATGGRRRDQFIAGRLFQDVRVVWTKDAQSAALINEAIEAARNVTLRWVSPDLPESFSANVYVRQLFRTSFRFEIRPETSGRADALFEAQRERLVPLLVPVLDQALKSGALLPGEAGQYRTAARPGFLDRVRLRAFFELSRLRATLRWFKHAATFDGWLDYILRKAERHSGEKIELTSWERRAPLIFLWPRAIRFILAQRRKGSR